MTRAHLADVTALAEQLGYPSSREQVEKRFDRLAASHDDYLCIAQTVEVPVAGWIHLRVGCTLESDPQVEVMGLVVHERARRRGVGRALMIEAEGWTRARGLGTIRLRSNIIRTEAHAFYQQLGFDVVKTQYAFEKRISLP